MQIVDLDDREWNPEGDRVRVLVPRPPAVVPNQQPCQLEITDLPSVGIAIVPTTRTPRPTDNVPTPSTGLN